MALSTSRTLITKTGISTTQIFDMGGINIPGGDFNLGSAIKLGNASGIITATSFSGNGAGLVGVASTDNINTSTNAVLSGIVTVGTLSVTGNAGIAGVLTFEDVSSVDSIGIITARSGIRVGANGLKRETVHLDVGDSGPNYLRFTNTTTGNGTADGFNVGINADENALLWNFENKDTIFATNNLERLRIKTDGNIGIGTTLPNVSGFNADAKVLTLSGPKRGIIELRGDIPAADTIGAIRFFSANNNEAEIKSVTNGSFDGDLVFTTNGNERLHIESTGDIIFKNNGGDNRIERDTTSGGPYLLFHNRGTGTTDNSGVYNLGGISAAGYRDVSNPSIVGSIQFERQPTAGGASSGCNIVFRTGFNGNTSHTNHNVRLELTYEGHLLPGANNTYDLGSIAKGWRNVYMNDLNLSNMNGDTNDVDGTQGSWTIQEGKNDLYIINRLNGKKFKIKMEEMS